jgi:subtilisin family serine protease
VSNAGIRRAGADIYDVDPGGGRRLGYIVEERNSKPSGRRPVIALAAALLFLLGLLAGSGDLCGSGSLGGFLADLTSSSESSESSGSWGQRRARSRAGAPLLAEDAPPLAGVAEAAPGGVGGILRAERVRAGGGAGGDRPGVFPGQRRGGERGLPGAPGTGLPLLRGGVISRDAPKAGRRGSGPDQCTPELPGAANWPGEVLLRPAALVGEESFAAFAEFMGSELDPRLSGCVLAKGLPAEVSEKEWAAFLKAEGLARAAYPNFRCWPTWTPNDPLVADQWHLDTVNLKQAWDITHGSSSLVIAICDTGIDTDHPDLAAKIIPGRNTADDPDTTNVEDIYGSHGTGVSGMAAAITNNLYQIAGAAPDCKIMPVRITNNAASGEATLADMVDGIAWAHQNGAHVVNCSYNGEPDTAFYDAMDDEGANADANGAVLVMAAGNNNKDMGPDKPWDHVLWIGSTDNTNAKSDFSQFGGAIDVVAPGTLVYVSVWNNGAATQASGTSFSSPCVAGVLGLMYSASFFSLTPAEYRSVLYSTCQDIGDPGEDDVFGWGLVDAYAAVVEIGTPTASISASPDSGQAPLVVNFTGSSNMEGHKPLTYTWDFGDGSPAGSGKSVAHTYALVGTYTVTLTVEDSDGLTDTDTVQINVDYGGVPEEIYLWEGQRVDYLFAPVGGANPATVTFAGGSLPSGLSLSGNRLTGYARKRGSWTCTLLITDGVSTPEYRTLRFRVTHRGFGRFREHIWR